MGKPRHALNNIAISFFLMIAVTGCNSGGQWKPPPPLPPEQNTPYTLTAKDAETVKKTISDRMKDPNSTQFRNLQAVTKQDGSIRVCGEVNAKNSFGGYNGFAPFVGELNANKFRVDVVPSNSSDIQMVVFDTCRRSGMDLGR